MFRQCRHDFALDAEVSVEFVKPTHDFSRCYFCWALIEADILTRDIGWQVVVLQLAFEFCYAVFKPPDLLF